MAIHVIGSSISPVIYTPKHLESIILAMMCVVVLSAQYPMLHWKERDHSNAKSMDLLTFIGLDYQ